MAALRHMTMSNRRAADILRRHNVHAATDVSGFGLLGHLMEMMRASGVEVTLLLHGIPVLDGAAETVAAGIFSSLQPQNLRLRRAVRNLEQAAADPVFPLLFDPQTAGGLLASVPADAAARCIAALADAGYVEAAVIGRVELRSDAEQPILIDLSRPQSRNDTKPTNAGKADANRRAYESAG
jgi:selenide,water dikinase